ncbi:MAG: phosphate-starvation-inducible PsiE family protein [Mariprofundaceae bacterium]|nr:phosphate-starvation-inducible PsiE family protein [Mariprofundaceae bacterium]
MFLDNIQRIIYILCIKINSNDALSLKFNLDGFLFDDKDVFFRIKTVHEVCCFLDYGMMKELTFMDIKKESHKILVATELVGLLMIVICTLIAVGFEMKTMITNQVVTLSDLLLLFIYLEIIAMVAVYLESGKLPVRMPLYIAIVALARYMILDMKNLDTWRILGISGAVFLIAMTVLVLRYGHDKFPYDEEKRSDLE